MKLNHLTRQLLATTVMGGLVYAAPAYAQTGGQGTTPVGPVVGASSVSATPQQTTGTDATGNTEATQQADIVVTGSLISSPNLTSTSPLTVVNAQEIKLQGTTRVEDLLNSLPQVFASEGSTDANGASGIATVDLRGLGTTRTLVLINGRRLVPGDPKDPVADLNFIPASLIQRIDILTGGASSTYGSDAVAGVVNFVLNKDFTGVQLDAQYSLYNHNDNTSQAIKNALAAKNFSAPEGNTTDGAQRTVTLTVGAGSSDGRGHVTAYASYRAAEAVTAGDRDFSSCALTAGAAGTFSCGGSSTSATGRFTQTTLLGFTDGVPTYVPTGKSLTVTGNNFTPYTAANAFNYNPYNYFQRPDVRYTLGAFAHYEVSKAFDPYLEVMFMDDRTNAVIAPSGAFYGTNFFVNCNNPFLSAGQSTALCGANAGTGTLQSVYIGRRNVEGGGRSDDLRHTDYRIVVGTKGELAKGITYDAYAQVGRAILSERYANDFSRNRLNNSLNVVTNAAGQAVCASTLPNAQGIVTDANCVPYNIFQTGGVTPAALRYLQTPGISTGSTSEYVANATISAQLGEYGLTSPFANSGVGLAFGAEYRRESLQIFYDTEFQTGDLAGQGTPFGVNDASGSFNVRDAFAELNVPLVEDKPFFKSLVLDASYRNSHYSSVGNTDTYKFGGEYAPIKDITFRAGYNRAVRAPNVLDLYNTPTVGLFSTTTDPCAGGLDANGTTVNGNTFAQCARSGVTAAEFGKIDQSPAGQYNQRTGGNAALTPEISDSYTLGAVIQPRYLRNFALTVDYYNIKIKNAIGELGASYTLNQCVATGSPVFCSQVNRAAGSGSLWLGNSYVNNTAKNLGNFQERGIDFDATYRVDTNNLGNFGMELVGTYLLTYKNQPLPTSIDPTSYDCAGYFGITCGTPNPTWRHSFRLTWNSPANIQISGKWRYFGPVDNDQNSPNPALGAPGTITTIDSHINAVSYFDLSLSTKIENKFTFRIGAQNILDRDPPVRSSTYSNNATNSYAQVYDSLGRYIYAGITLDL